MYTLLLYANERVAQKNVDRQWRNFIIMPSASIFRGSRLGNKKLIKRKVQKI